MGAISRGFTPDLLALLLTFHIMRSLWCIKVLPSTTTGGRSAFGLGEKLNGIDSLAASIHAHDDGGHAQPLVAVVQSTRRDKLLAACCRDGSDAIEERQIIYEAPLAEIALL